jgi:hypothetical protein
VVVHLDVIIDIDPGALPLGIDIGANGQGFQNRFFEGLEQVWATALREPKATGVVSCKKR